MRLSKVKWASSVLAALLVASIAVGAGSSLYGGQVSRSDLFRKFFTWTGLGNVTLSPGTSLSAPNLTGTAASGSDSFSVAANGSRTHFGAGASDYASSNGTTVTFASPLAATAAAGNSAFSVPVQAYISLDPTGNDSFIRAPAAGVIGLTTNIVQPESDNATALGGPSNRWSLINVMQYRLGSAATFAFATAPTISSGFGGTPSIVASNGSVAFEVNVGTGASASSGVIGLPTATTGWVCHCQNLNPTAGALTEMTATTTASCTLSNLTLSTGIATAWSASAILWCTAFAL